MVGLKDFGCSLDRDLIRDLLSDSAFGRCISIYEEQPEDGSLYQ